MKDTSPIVMTTDSTLQALTLSINTNDYELVNILRKCTAHIECGHFHPIVFDAIEALQIYAGKNAYTMNQTLLSTSLASRSTPTKDRQEQAVNENGNRNISNQTHDNHTEEKRPIEPPASSLYSSIDNNSEANSILATEEKKTSHTTTPSNNPETTSDGKKVIATETKLSSTLYELATQVDNNEFDPTTYISLSQLHNYANRRIDWLWTAVLTNHDEAITSIISYLGGHYIFVAPVCKKFHRTYLAVHSHRRQTYKTNVVASVSCLAHARDRGYPWDGDACRTAASTGRLEVLQWARSQGCPWDKRTCSEAVRNGHVAVLRWARSQGCPWDARTRSWAWRRGHLTALTKNDVVKGCFWWPF